MTLRCWKCGTLADVHDWHDIVSGYEVVRRIPTDATWRRPDCTPGLGGHDGHPPPTPEQLIDSGQRILDRIWQITIDALT